jgi:hypothetical protein
MNRTNSMNLGFIPGLGARSKWVDVLRVFLVASAGAAISACDRAPSAPAGAGTESTQSKIAAPSGRSVPAPPELEQFQRVLDARGNSPMPQQPVETDPQALQDPFKAALDESNRQRAAAAAFPFGTPK